jgi:hypothetical protein
MSALDYVIQSSDVPDENGDTWRIYADQSGAEWTELTARNGRVRRRPRRIGDWIDAVEIHGGYGR